MSGFAGARVLSLESRRGSELAKLIATYGGEAVVAPAMREVPLESNKEALDFAKRFFDDEYDILIFLTGVGTRALLNVVETKYKREDYIAALQKSVVVPRGPKPVAVLREWGVTPAVTVPEPNTWRELLATLDEAGATREELRLRGKRLAVQEYGVSNPELLNGLRERGAMVTRVPVYQWALPDDRGPLEDGIKALAKGEIDVVFFTTSVQVTHLFEVAKELKLEEAMRTGLKRTMVASIGPTTSEELQRRGIPVDLEPSHPKMGFLVKEAAEQSAEVLRRKRAASSAQLGG
jgi:uroporphyrinogen-III synthase